VAVKRLAQEAGPGTAAGLTSAEQFEAEVKPPRDSLYPIHFMWSLLMNENERSSAQ
jgi:hypothetical protein